MKARAPECAKFALGNAILPRGCLGKLRFDSKKDWLVLMTVHNNFKSAHAAVNGLVDRFEKNHHHYLSPGYQEQEARKDFLDKFFMALGWDVNHETQTNPYEQEVKIEKSVTTGTAKRRADYSFSLAPHFTRYGLQNSPTAEL